MANAVEAAELVEAYLPLALSIANRWDERWPWLRDDFRSEAAFALWRAAKGYTTDKPYSFPTAVHVAVRRACWERLRQEARKAPEAFRAPPADPELDPLNMLEDDTPPASEAIDAADAVGKLLPLLTPDQAAAVESRFIDGRTVAEIAAERETTTEAVRDMIARGLRRMRIGIITRHKKDLTRTANNSKVKRP